MNKKERDMWGKIEIKLELIKGVMGADSIEPNRKEIMIAELKEKIREDKLDIRLYMKHQKAIQKRHPYDYMTPSYFSGDYDSATYIYKLPYVVNDRQKVQIKSALIQYCTPSQYDCTGQWFTVSLKIFTTPTTTFIYHHLACDC